MRDVASRRKNSRRFSNAFSRSTRPLRGEIWAESKVGQGSKFFFTIPRMAPKILDQPSAGRTILVCDDDESVREIMCTVLNDKGYRSVGVSSGRELIDRVSSVAPDAIVLDMLMPGLKGCETLAILKQNPATASIPVVIASVFSPTES